MYEGGSEENWNTGVKWNVRKTSNRKDIPRRVIVARTEKSLCHSNSLIRHS